MTDATTPVAPRPASLVQRQIDRILAADAAVRSVPSPASPVPAPTSTRKPTKGPSLRIERDYPHLRLPVARVNVSAGTRDKDTRARYRSILDQLAHARSGQAFFQTWLSMDSGRWGVPEIARTFRECSEDAEATIARLLHRSLQEATWSQARDWFKQERTRLKKKGVAKQLQQLDVYRRWLTANGYGEAMPDLLAPRTIADFLAHIAQESPARHRAGGVSPRTQNQYREAIMQFAQLVTVRWPGLTNAKALREQVKQAELRDVAPRRLDWSRAEERAYYLGTYTVRAGSSRGRKPVHRPDIGLALRVIVQTAMDVGDVLTKLKGDMFVKDATTGRWRLKPGMRSKIEGRSIYNLSRDRVIPVSDELVMELAAHATVYADSIRAHDGLAFGWLSHGELQRAHERLAEALGWGPSRPKHERITLKDLRHCGPQRWERALRTESDVAKRMGHDDPRTVRIYLRGEPPTDADRIVDEHAAAQVAAAPWRYDGSSPLAEPASQTLGLLLTAIAGAQQDACVQWPPLRPSQTRASSPSDDTEHSSTAASPAHERPLLGRPPE